MTTLHEQFGVDMEDAGYDVEHDYHGRFYYEGPAVRINKGDLQDVIRSTAIRLQWDEMGRDGLIIYPWEG